jgi:hypothetical protein
MTGCNTVIYEPLISILPIRLCDKINQGVSPLCNLENEQVRILPFLYFKNPKLFLKIMKISATSTLKAMMLYHFG